MQQKKPSAHGLYTQAKSEANRVKRMARYAGINLKALFAVGRLDEDEDLIATLTVVKAKLAEARQLVYEAQMATYDLADRYIEARKDRPEAEGKGCDLRVEYNMSWARAAEKRSAEGK